MSLNSVRTNGLASVGAVLENNPVLFAASAASGVRYRIEGMDAQLMSEINALVGAYGEAAVQERCIRLLDSGCRPIYDGYVYLAHEGYEVLKENLDVLNPRLPKVIEQMLWNHFFEGDQEVDMVSVTQRIIEQNPCNITRPEVKYPYMIKSFLYAAYCGLTAGTLWNGEAQVNGGFITVDQDGTVCANYALESEEFKDYLFNNCYLEFPATSKGHGNYAYVYEYNGNYCFNLNFQIRYR